MQRYIAAGIFAAGFAACSSETTNPDQGTGGTSTGGQSGIGASGGNAGTGGSTPSGGSGGSGETGGTGGSAGGDAATDAPSCQTVTLTAIAMADTTIFPEVSLAAPNCGGTVTQGSNSLLSIGAVNDNASRALLRFAAKGAAGKTIKSAKLLITRDQGVSGKDYGCGVGSPCPNSAGNVSVFALTQDWTEGAGPSSGANWCRKDYVSSTPWAVNGADGNGTDRSSSPAGIQPFVKDAGTVAVSLDPTVFQPWMKTENTDLVVSLLLVAGNGGQLFFYSREHPENGATQAAALEIQFCQ